MFCPFDQWARPKEETVRWHYIQGEMTGAHAWVLGWCPASAAANWTCHYNFCGFPCLSLCIWPTKRCDFIISLGHCLWLYFCVFLPVWLCLLCVRHYVTKVHMSLFLPLMGLQCGRADEHQSQCDKDSKRGLCTDQGGSDGGDIWTGSQRMCWPLTFPLMELLFLPNGNQPAQRASINQ